MEYVCNRDEMSQYVYIFYGRCEMNNRWLVLGGKMSTIFSRPFTSATRAIFIATFKLASTFTAKLLSKSNIIIIAAAVISSRWWLYNQFRCCRWFGNRAFGDLTNTHGKPSQRCTSFLFLVTATLFISFKCYSNFFIYLLRQIHHNPFSILALCLFGKITPWSTRF